MLPWICLEQNKLIELGDVDRRHWHRPIGELFSIIHFWLCWLWLWLWLCWLWLWLWWWWSSLVMMIADIDVGQCGGLSSLPHSLAHSCLWSLFWREHAISVLSLQIVYSHSNWRVFIKCAFRKYVKLSKHFKTIQPSPFRIQLGNFFYAHLYPIHKKYCI